jgi:acyl-coenzyme A thioesterase PaaI-like protein
MNDLEKLVLIQSKKAPCIETLSGRPLKFSSEPPQIEMEFEGRREFTHSDTEILQGGFVTGMLDATMANLVMALLEMKAIPISLDINVSFLATAHPGKLVCVAKAIKVGKSICFMSGQLFQDEILVANATSTVKLIHIKE